MRLAFIAGFYAIATGAGVVSFKKYHVSIDRNYKAAKIQILVKIPHWFVCT